MFEERFDFNGGESLAEEVEGEVITIDESSAINAEQENNSTQTLKLRYNHEDIEVDAKKAAELAQKGMQAEKLMQGLKYVASARKCGPNELVKKLISEDEEAARQLYLEKTGGDEELTDKLLDIRRQELGGLASAYDEAQEKESVKHTTERISGELYSLMAENDEITSIDDISDSVLTEAAKNGVSLKEAYYREAYLNAKAALNARLKAEAAAAATAGSLYEKPDSAMSPEIDAMMKGIWGN